MFQHCALIPRGEDYDEEIADVEDALTALLRDALQDKELLTAPTDRLTDDEEDDDDD